jgi:alpha-beta hydrolase superfamily lysophospholipase
MSGFFRRRWRWIVGFAVTFSVLGLIISWKVGSALCAPHNHPVALPKDLAVEQVSFPSDSGATIHGWLIASETNRAIVILQHGVRGSKSSLVERARFLSEAGYGVLMFDFQAHGESIGSHITFGYLESRDSQAAVTFIKNRFPGKPIGILGLSLGAAAAALAKPPLDAQAMVFEMMYPTIVDATKDRIEMRLGPLGRFFSPFLTAQLQPRIGCNLDDLRPIVSVETISVPKLFIAGTADRNTKLKESQEIYAHAAAPKSFASFDGAQHEDLLKFNPEKYKQIVLEFLNANLK